MKGLVLRFSMPWVQQNLCPAANVDPNRREGEKRKTKVVKRTGKIAIFRLSLII